MTPEIIQLDIAQTLAMAAVLLLVGEFVKKRFSILERFFIPGPVIGGLIFSIVALVGYQTQTFEFEFYANIRNLLMMVFFTTIGFSASLELLKKGGVGVALFLLAATVLVVIQNTAGVALAEMLGLHPLIGLSAGSVSLTGGHGTSAAFGPILEQAGATAALPAAIAASTWGLVAGCMIGGPVGTLLMKRYKLNDRPATSQGMDYETNLATARETKVTNEKTVIYAVMLIVIAMGIGSLIVPFVKRFGLTLPAYIGPMLVAAVMRNVIDWKNLTLPAKQIEVAGSISLSFFLCMALMSMKLWELGAIAGPLLVILCVQTAIMGVFAYFVTFNLMGRDYDAAVLAAGHCGFGLGATPNAMANMDAFTVKNGASVKAFFVLPLVGALFIDFVNATIITAFVGIFS
ncbi:glutamate:Na+ symporter, ESS family [Polaromonas sp. OV174]|uniref:sodium/glutamate symporter n=1 Tax=Polaromonas sp. OV174 TaxID=1855300 RepID=UPI0008EC113D|nr:sodium/glutamate symporter [Polaromonas sp. OV174]SFC39504.1 glutamate:Na+ symporter, ESS family [Polaromonas sp. OV174]